MIGAFWQQESLPILDSSPERSGGETSVGWLRERSGARQPTGNAAGDPLPDLGPFQREMRLQEILCTGSASTAERSSRIHQLFTSRSAIPAPLSWPWATGPRGGQLVEQLPCTGDPKIQQVIRHARDKRL